MLRRPEQGSQEMHLLSSIDLIFLASPLIQITMEGMANSEELVNWLMPSSKNSSLPKDALELNTKMISRESIAEA
jgi:hypothetical protein